jgi:DNA-directed RNA polymerase
MAYARMRSQIAPYQFERTRLQSQGGRERIDARKQVDRMPPNVIHALDAAALTLALNEMENAGARGAAAIHDSAAYDASHLARRRDLPCPRHPSLMRTASRQTGRDCSR